MDSTQTELPDEEAPLNSGNDNGISTDDYTDTFSKLRAFVVKLKSDTTYRRNYIIAVNLISSFFALVCICVRL